MTTAQELTLRDQDGKKRGCLTISCLPGGERWKTVSTLEAVGDGDESDSVARTRLLEETTYQYVIELDGSAEILHLEPSELFSADTAARTHGRLKAGRTTGTVRVSITTGAAEVCNCAFEVRSRKLDYETEYRRMMLRLADEAAELVQSSFAAGSFGGFSPDQDADSRTLYQRFAFLESLLDSEGFAEAVDVIRYRPHSQYETEDEIVDPAVSLKPSRGLAQQLTRATERQPLARPVAGMRSIPRTITRSRHTETLDTDPNRFLRFAFEHWKALAGRVGELLRKSGPRAERGGREARRIESRLEHLLTIPALAEAGPLRRFPGENTVLNGRAGYREVLRAFLIGEVATSLTWEGGEDVFSAGKRDVATLYEYWVFLELARSIEVIPGFTFNRSELLVKTTDGLGLDLRRGHQVVLRGEGRRRGRTVNLELWFNKSFDGSVGADGSWTVRMRPDCSLRIRPAQTEWDAATWIHFDAKYRIEHYSEIIGDPDKDDDEDLDSRATPTGQQAKRDDLRKMHAYRDAIRRTAGAYVLYPGRDGGAPEERRQYHEVLPGLGAFVLRPSETGEATPSASKYLIAFLTDVIDHVASQGTGRERARYWEDETYAAVSPEEQRHDYIRELAKPAADSPVLLGFVRSPEHLQWIADQRLYNLRADPERAGSVSLGSPVVSASFLVLYDRDSEEVTAYCTTGALFVRSGEDLRTTGYPTGQGTSGSGSLYLCLELGNPILPPISGQLARLLGAADGSPVMMSWAELVRHSSSE